MGEHVVGGGAEHLGPTGGVDRARHSFYSRFINYRSDIVKIDALVEAALGVTLLVGGFGASDFPHPVGRAVVVAAAALLLLLAAALWFLPIGLPALAAGNAATAVLAVTWLAVASRFSVAGGALVAATVAALICLAATQAATLRR
jgi:hypothetical protein